MQGPSGRVVRRRAAPLAGMPIEEWAARRVLVSGGVAPVVLVRPQGRKREGQAGRSA